MLQRLSRVLYGSMISQRTIEAVRRRASLLEVVSESVTLKRLGSRHTGLCPFHSERSPSFSVNAELNLYHCFGCGASGDTLAYIMNTRGVSFTEAVELLAERFGIPIERVGKQNSANVKQDLSSLARLTEFATKFYQESLRRAPPDVHAYIENRGLGEEILTHFEIGFAPPERTRLVQALKKKGVHESLMLESALAKKDVRGELYDVFRGRLMFPIRTEKSRVVGFGGRVIPTLYKSDEVKSIPKYINSPENPLFKKSKVLYGITQALETIRRKKRVIVVEGNIDVLSFYQAGLTETVATCGTALTNDHVDRLKHLTRQVLLIFDGDAAGQKAAGKLFPLFANSQLDVKVVVLPPGTDPDSFAREHGSQTASALEQCETVSLFHAFIKFLAHERGAEPRNLAASLKGEVASLSAHELTKVSNSVEQHELLEQGALLLGIPSGEYRRLVRPESNQGQVRRDPIARVATEGAGMVTISPLERDILVAVTSKPSLLHSVLIDTEIVSAVSSDLLEVLQLLEAVHASRGQLEV